MIEVHYNQVNWRIKLNDEYLFITVYFVLVKTELSIAEFHFGEFLTPGIYK